MKSIVCPDCGNLYHGRECDLCAPMARTFARIKSTPRAERDGRKPKTYKREWRSGVESAVPPEKD